MTHRFSSHDPARGADTAGTPWRGRTLTGTGFDGDTGEADAELARLLARAVGSGAGVGAGADAAAAGGETAAAGVDPDAAGVDPVAVVAAVARARLVVPIVAVPGEIDDSSGIPADASSDMASVTLVAPDGQRALPAFTSTAALAAWDAEARPVPVTAQRAALAAVQEGCTVIPLDLPGTPGPAAYTLTGSMVWALAMARDWVPAHQDQHVARAVSDAVRVEGAVRGHRLGGQGGELVVELALASGLTRVQVQEIVTAIGERLAVDAETRARIDAVSFRLTSA